MSNTIALLSFKFSQQHPVVRMHSFAYTIPATGPVLYFFLPIQHCPSLRHHSLTHVHVPAQALEAVQPDRAHQPAESGRHLGRPKH